MGKEWFALIGVLVGGAITYGVTYLKMRHDEKRDRVKLYLQKLEDMHKAVNKITEIYSHIWIEHVSIIKFGFKEPTKYEKPIPIDELKMLIDFYAPQLSVFVDQLEHSRKEYGKILMRCYEADELDMAEKVQLGKQVGQGYDLIVKCCGYLKREIIKESKVYLNI